MDFTAFKEFSYSLIIFVLFCFALLVQLWYYLFFFRRLAFHKKKQTPSFTPPTSIIICARNEDHNIVDFLPKIFEQDYPEFEVVVVNDCSFDNTGDILNEFAKKHFNLKIVTVKENENHQHGKKVALMLGIKGATHEHLLLTDADCKPKSKNWLRLMMKNFNTETEIVLGYGAYERKKGLLNKLIRFDTFLIALQYLSFSLAKRTYMGTGRNLAYCKSLFFQMKGFASHYHIQSGDDDLFINEAATKKNTTIEINIGSQTVSRVKIKMKDWIRQKRRHVSTFKHYTFGSKFRLAIMSFSQYLFYISFCVLLVLKFQIILILSLFVVRFMLQMLIFNKSMKQLDEKDLFLLSPLLEVILMIIYPVISLSNSFNKKINWK